MFDRFSQRALRAILYVHSVGSELGSSSIEPEHILLGILHDKHGLGMRILAETGDGLDDLRNDIAHLVAGREKVPPSKEVPFSASCQRVLEHAAEEADRLRDTSIGTEHLLLGLLREEGGVAAEALVSRGLRIEAVREAILASRSRGESPEPPGPPGTPANTYRWPQIPFVPSRTVHILHSGAQPHERCINHPRNVFSAYGFTLEEIIVQAWEGSRWHIEMPPRLRDDARFDFLMVLPRPETSATCLGLVRSAVEQQFGVRVTRERRMRDVYRVTNTARLGPMLRRYPDPPAGIGFSQLAFSTFIGRSKNEPMFPLEGFAVHSVPFRYLVTWFEEILGGQVIDETDLPGIYGFELTERVDTPAAFIQLLREGAGLLITREQREAPTLIVQQAEPGYDSE